MGSAGRAARSKTLRSLCGPSVGPCSFSRGTIVVDLLVTIENDVTNESSEVRGVRKKRHSDTVPDLKENLVESYPLFF